MSDYSFIVWHDALNGEPNLVECLSYETAKANPGDAGNAEKRVISVPPLAAGDFVIIVDSDQSLNWMAQVVNPQRNLPLQGLSRESPSAVAVFERILAGEINKSIFLNQVYYYRLQLIGEIANDGRLRSVRRRPRAGSVGIAATEDAIRKALDLPAVHIGKNAHNNVIGRIHSTSVPVAIDWQAFKQHILAAGATGSGKTNTIANLIKAAQAYDACVIVYDQKPDYQDLKDPNDEIPLFEGWHSETIARFGLEHVHKFALFQGEEAQSGETLIAVRARDVPRGMLVSALFPNQDEGNQRDVFGALLGHYAQKNKEWTLNLFSQWVINARKPQQPGKPETSELARLAQANGWGMLNEMTLDAMQRKMKQRRMKWLDALEEDKAPTRGGAFDPSTSRKSHDGDKQDVPVRVQGYFEPKGKIEPGKVLVLRTNASGREYGLFLSYMLREVYDQRRSGTIKCRVVNVVDEAQDIFESGVADATSTLNEIIRKGRSNDIAFVVAVQSVSQVPDSVLTNMNTRIVHRQNSMDELRAAIPSASKDLMVNSLTFGPGEALASIIGARSTIHTQMAPSPFKLTKMSAEQRETLADQKQVVQA